MWNWPRPFFQALVKHIEDQEVDSYTEEVKKYDQISRLDPWYTSLLLKVKRQISEDDLR